MSGRVVREDSSGVDKFEQMPEGKEGEAGHVALAGVSEPERTSAEAPRSSVGTCCLI